MSSKYKSSTNDKALKISQVIKKIPADTMIFQVVTFLAYRNDLEKEKLQNSVLGLKEEF